MENVTEILKMPFRHPQYIWDVVTLAFKSKFTLKILFIPIVTAFSC